MYDHAFEPVQGLAIEEGPSSGNLEVLKNAGLDPDVNIVGSKSTEGYPIDIHLPAMKISGNSDHGLGDLILVKIVACVEIDFPFFGNGHITTEVHCLGDIRCIVDLPGVG